MTVRKKLLWGLQKVEEKKTRVKKLFREKTSRRIEIKLSVWLSGTRLEKVNHEYCVSIAAWLKFSAKRKQKWT